MRAGRRHPLPALLLSVSIAGTAGSLRAAADGDLQPLAESSPLVGRLGAVGIIVVKEDGSNYRAGTGFLVTPCHVVTAAHVLSRENTQVAPGLQVRFTPSYGERALAVAGRQIRGSVVATSEDFIPRPGGKSVDIANVARDWALIELERPVAGVEPFKLAYPGAELPTGLPMFALGYASGDHRGELYADENCPLWRGHAGGRPPEGVLVADCAVRPGMSGGPLLFDADGQLVVAGVLVERMEVKDRVFTVAVQVRSFADRVAPVLRQSRICAAGTPFALPAEPAGESR